jgi:LacI family transcriptional regulator
MVSQESEEKEKKHIQTLLAMRVDGIIISLSQETKDYTIFENLIKKNIPLVFIDRIPKMKNINKVFVDDKNGSFKAIEHAIKLGYTKIGHIGGYTQVNIGQQRLLGFEKAMKKYKIPINPKWIFKGGFGVKHGYDSFMKLYNEDNLPELIFTVTYPVALGIYKAVNELGIKIPDDIDIICFGDAEEQKYLSPALSCIKQPTNLIAENAMEIMLNQLNESENREVKTIEIPTELILRGTCLGKLKD